MAAEEGALQRSWESPVSRKKENPSLLRASLLKAVSGGMIRARASRSFREVKAFPVSRVGNEGRGLRVHGEAGHITNSCYTISPTSQITRGYVFHSITEIPTR